MESSIGIFFKGYPYFYEKFKKKDTNILKTRLLLQKAIVMKGEDAAELFYTKEKFRRKGATPKRFKKTLLGEGGVQGLDKEEHLHRKEMFMQIMNPDSIGKLQNYFEKYWYIAFKNWQKQDHIVLFPEVEKILLRAACKWTGVPLSAKEVEKRTRYFSRMIDGSGAVGPRHWKGRAGRSKAEAWMEKIIKRLRKDPSIYGTKDSIIHKFSFHKDPNGKLLKKEIVAVEVINLLRPIVAIARYIVFTAHALHENPGYRTKLTRASNENLDLYFVQEVRRFYPFFPFVAAKATHNFEWNNISFPKGRRVLLDIYATCHDEGIWKNANQFYPERFRDWDGSAFNFIPQGGGDHNKNHRCAGEWITIDLTRIALDQLVNKMTYNVPDQDLEIDMARIPAIPKSRFILNNISAK